jgi:NAD(P) transhydrogenase
MDNFDLIVIGSGPAGEKGAAAAAYFGKKVALVEKETHPGGAAANTGTLPSKTLRETAVTLSGLRQRKLLGLNFSLNERVGVSDFLSQERRVKDNERVRIIENLDRHQIRVFRGVATLMDEHTVSVTPGGCDPLLLRGDKILIATGSHPHRPKDQFPFSNPHIYDSDTILSLYEVPPSLLVVGGGVIGCEYACIFVALGVKVTLLEKRAGLLGEIDRDIVASLTEQMRDQGIRVILQDEIATVKDAGLKTLEVELRGGEVLLTSAILVSSGRSGQTVGMGLEKAGIQVTKRGHIVVDPRTFQTAVPNVYAAGDVVGNPALASTAMAQARMAIGHAFGLPFNLGLADVLPYGIYTIPECSGAGVSEDELRRTGVPYVAGRMDYALNARGQIIGDHKGFLKLLFREDDMELLGVHIIGEQATELVHIGLTALLVRAKVDLFIHTCYNYPTLSELYKYAAYSALINREKKRAAAEAPTPTPAAQ